MLKVLVAFIIYIVSLLLLLRVSIWMAQRLVIRWVEKRHREAESIISLRRPPESWTRTRKSRWTLKSSRHSPNQLAKTGLAGKRAEAVCLKRLDKLIKYFQVSGLLDEETRQTLLDGLGSVRALWRGRSWQETGENG